MIKFLKAFQILIFCISIFSFSLIASANSYTPLTRVPETFYSGCTYWFVANKANLPMVASANHCYRPGHKFRERHQLTFVDSFVSKKHDFVIYVFSHKGADEGELGSFPNYELHQPKKLALVDRQEKVPVRVSLGRNSRETTGVLQPPKTVENINLNMPTSTVAGVIRTTRKATLENYSAIKGFSADGGDSGSPVILAGTDIALGALMGANGFGSPFSLGFPSQPEFYDFVEKYQIETVDSLPETIDDFSVFKGQRQNGDLYGLLDDYNGPCRLVYRDDTVFARMTNSPFFEVVQNQDSDAVCGPIGEWFTTFTFQEVNSYGIIVDINTQQAARLFDVEGAIRPLQLVPVADESKNQAAQEFLSQFQERSRMGGYSDFSNIPITVKWRTQD